jgi:oligopeptide/dipeptide ABC transporter ATP-binding protein
MTAAPLLRLEDVRIEFRTHDRTTVAVNGVSIEVKAGESIGIVGESGSGKSTLARAILGLLEGGIAPTAGRFVVNGKQFKASELRTLRGRTIAMVFQDPLSYLNPIKTAGKQIAASVRLHDKGADVDARVRELLDLVRLPAACRLSYPHELSGGMRQRVLLAMALGCRPSLLIADEPTTALDVTTQSEILALIRELRTTLNMSLMLISHDLGVVSSMCERIYIMYRGRVVEEGATRAIFDRPSHPYSVGLVNASRAAQDERGRFVTIDDSAVSAEDRPGCAFNMRCQLAVDKCRADVPPLEVHSEDGLRKVRCWQRQAAAHA